MKIREIVIIVVTCCFATVSYSDTPHDYSSIVLGGWVTSESLLVSQIESNKTSPYFKYEFKPDNVLFYASNDIERGEKLVYSIDGDVLKMFGYTYTIESYNDGILKMSTVTKWGSVEYSFTLLRKEKYDSLWRFAGQANTNEYTKPLFGGNFHLFDYVFSNSSTPKEFEKERLFISEQQASVPPKEDIILKISLRIDSMGGVDVLKIFPLSNITKGKIEKIKTKIENTSGYWFPAMQQGVKTTTSLELVFVKRGASSLKFRNKALEFFTLAYNAFQKEDYYKALEYSTSAINLDRDKVQFYLLRALCNLKMNDVDRYCGDVLKAYAISPLVSLTNVELVNGEMLEIKCGENK